LSSVKSEACITIDGTSLPIVVRRYAAAKGYRLRYDAAQDILRLSIPARGSEREALRWAREQQIWVRTQLARRPQPRRLVPGGRVPVEGVERLILWDRAHARTLCLDDGRLLVGGTEESVGPRIVRWLRCRALDTLAAESHEIAARAGLEVASVRIGDPRSRWGSCSASGDLRYSWRLILAPPHVRRATVAHEVAHLLHMDHSPAFHAAHVRLLGGDTAPARAWLRAHGAGLHQITG
jgi:predicted metal-dependent hydrolase